MSYILRLKSTSSAFERFARFVVVGSISTALDFSLLIVLKEFIGISSLLAVILSYTAGLVANFTLNKLWIYPDVKAKKSWLQLAQFVTVSGMGLLLSVGIVGLFEHQTGYIAAKAIATAFVVVWSFCANRYWTFGKVSVANNA